MIAVSDIISLVAAERKGTFHHPCLHPGTHVSMGRREVKVSAKQMSQIPVGITSQSFNPKPQGIVFCIFFQASLQGNVHQSCRLFGGACG